MNQDAIRWWLKRLNLQPGQATQNKNLNKFSVAQLSNPTSVIKDSGLNGQSVVWHSHKTQQGMQKIVVPTVK